MFKDIFSKNMIVVLNAIFSLILGLVLTIISNGNLIMQIVGIVQIYSAILLCIIVVNKYINNSRSSNSESDYRKKNELLAKLIDNIETNEINSTKEKDKLISKNSNNNKSSLVFSITILFISILFVLISADLVIRIREVIELNTNILDDLGLIVTVIIQFFVYLFLYNWYFENQNTKMNYLGFARLNQIISFLVLIMMIVKLLGLSVVSNILFMLLLLLVFVFYGYCIVATSLLIFNKNENEIVINMKPLSLVLSKKNPLVLILDYFEENTKITFRSIYSLKYIKDSIPLLIACIGIILLLSTCVVQIKSHNQGVIYTLGKLEKDKVLNPGLYYKLPWPIQKIESFEVTRVKTFTVGYEDNSSSNYLWTVEHNGDEYKLLLGNGKELVSVNC